MSELMFCPFCGGKSYIRGVGLPDDAENEIVYVPQCSECGASGVPVPTIEDAQYMWNRRHEILVVQETETKGDAQW